MDAKRIAVGTFTPCALAALLIGVEMGSKTPNECERFKTVSGNISSIGTDEDSSALEKWQWERLQDPLTGTISPGIATAEAAFVRDHLLKTGGRMSDFTWTSRGPNNVGGRTRAFAIDVTNENVLLAAGVSGGMWRSEDQGLTWTRTSALTDVANITAIAQDVRPGKTMNWYFGTGERSGSSSWLKGSGVYRSTDGGRTWSVLQSTVGMPVWNANYNDFDYVSRIVLNHKRLDSTEIMVATGLGPVFRSIDDGASWTVTLGGKGPYPKYSFDTDVAITPGGTWYAALSEPDTNKGIWRSTNGTTWTRIFSPSVRGLQQYNRTVIGICPSNENVIYTLTHVGTGGLNGNSFWKYTYIAGDGSGGNGVWEDRSQNLPTNIQKYLNFGLQLQSGYDMVLSVKPDNDKVVYLGGVYLYRSTNGFATADSAAILTLGRPPGGSIPSDVDIYSHHVDQHGVSFPPSNPLKMYSIHDGGISVTDSDTASYVRWRSLNGGYVTTQGFGVGLNPINSADPSIAMGMQDNGLWYSDAITGSTPWRVLNAGDGGGVVVLPPDSLVFTDLRNMNHRGIRLCIGAIQVGAVYRFDLLEGFGDFVPSRVDPVTTDPSRFFIHPFAIDRTNGRTMYYPAGAELWRNNDLSKVPFNNSSKTTVNWVKLSNSGLGVGESISSLEASVTPPNILYYGTSSGKLYRMNNAHLGNETGVLRLTRSGTISSIAVDRSDANRAIVAFSNYETKSLVATTDGGQTWTDVGGNLEEFPDGSGGGPSVRAVEILNYGGKKYYLAGTSSGLYSTTTLAGDATVWSLEGSTTIGTAIVEMIDSRDVDGYVVVGTHGSGAFTARLATTPFAPTPALPALVSPASGATDQPANVILRWRRSTAAQNYQLQVSRDTTSNSFAVSDSTVADTLRQMYEIATTAKYFWRVRAQNYIGSSAYSPWWNFSTGTRTGAEDEAASQNIPREFSLSQNYPNPFNPSTVIRYGLPTRSHVKLEIFDMLGRKVVSLVDEEQESRFYEKSWHAAVSSGLYFYRLEAVSSEDPSKSFVQVRKMLMIK